MTVTARLLAIAAAAAASTAALVGVAPAASACTPHLESQGPSVRVTTYPDPDVTYDGTGTFVRFVTCL
jgi:hypothetical protein